MLSINTLNRSVGITIKKTGCIEDLVDILMNNGYWVRLKPAGDSVIVEIKEDN